MGEKMNLDCEYISFDKQIKYFEVISESKKLEYRGVCDLSLSVIS